MRLCVTQPLSFTPSKKSIHTFCMEHIHSKIIALQKSISALADDAAREMKSSAGDKHETSRAMMQLEQEKLTYQLAEAENQKAVLEKINPQQVLQHITIGSLVVTNLNILFFASAIGKINVDGKDIMVLSIQSPVGVELKGKGKDDVVNFNGRQVEVLEVM